jgi:hypothetical protein
MANRNRNAFTTVLLEKNINNAQIITGKNPDNVIALNVQGYTFDRLSSFTKLDVELLADDIACMGTQKAFEKFMACRSSVAKQKVNNAHGRTVIEALEHALAQNMTYADSIKPLIQLKGKRLSDALECLKDITESQNTIFDENMNYYKTWVKHVVAWYTDKESCKFHAKGVELAKNFIMNALHNGDILIVDEHVYTRYCLENFIKLWAESNSVKYSDADIDKAISEWVRALGE